MRMPLTTRSARSALVAVAAGALLLAAAPTASGVARTQLPGAVPAATTTATAASVAAYAATPDVPELMLRRMFLGDPYGNYDRILDYSTALTGSLYYVPTGDFLDDLPAPPA